ncbi:MAG TPA: hypothetical protein VMM78_04255 [Thermomicrobiales bacterium]|nr:hypothetical protein [Thermomicrobiales bacterium]
MYTRRSARDEMFEAIAFHLANAGLLAPARDFVDQVRATAGIRISPREVLTAVTQMASTNRSISVESVAALVSDTRGDRSRRQHRYADEWRALGALLTLRGDDGSPEAQRAFIGEARHAAGKRPSDLMLLRVAIAAAELGIALDTTVIGKVARRLPISAAQIGRDELRDAVQHETRMLRRESTRGTGRVRGARPATTSSAGIVTRRWRPGGRRNRSMNRGRRRSANDRER